MNKERKIAPPSPEGLATQLEHSSFVDGIDCFLAGTYSIKVEEDAKDKKSDMKLSIGLSRPGSSISYINVVIRTDLVTGLSELCNMEISKQNQFSSVGYGSRVTTSADKKRNFGRFYTSGSVKQKEERKLVRKETTNPEDELENINDAVSSILEIAVNNQKNQ